jgi:hypothetical protein
MLGLLLLLVVVGYVATKRPEPLVQPDAATFSILEPSSAAAEIERRRDAVPRAQRLALDDLSSAMKHFAEADAVERVCIEMRTSDIFAGCHFDSGADFGPAFHGPIADLRRFVSKTGVSAGMLVYVDGFASINEIVARIVRDDDAGRPCAVMGSPGSRMIAILGPETSCEVAPAIQAALDRQARRTELACLEIVRQLADAGLVRYCGQRDALAGLGGETATFVDRDGDWRGGVLIPNGDAGFDEKLATMRGSNRARPCEVVGSRSSGMMAVMPSAVDCDEWAPRFQSVLDHFQRDN